ncbi:juvenile hormone esterase-like [Epargyreus clarus]|uniref:juvenile hormone esterase-like n=1 Tax=Epargyreus clarus TaxID=520877 RepID=UPI003C2D3D05
MKKGSKFTYSKLLVLLWVSAGSSTLESSTPVVVTQQGRLRGLRSIMGQNRYYSIPYATAERFQLPKDPPSWEGIYDAFNPVRSCLQNLSVFVIGYEDCLVLDVYTPESIQSSHKLPVMVFIHGGAYYYGGKTLYNPEFIVTKNVIVVSVNYRIGVHGFLCLNGISNLGLRDQVAAMKWVQKNIAAFGGDPDNVTLCGQSAGAAAVSMHFLSKESKGLFHKAILMSGNALVPWAFNLESFTPALEDARKLGNACTEEDVYNTFLNAPIDKLVRATVGTSVNPRYFKYTPCVDTNSTYPFFTDKPYNIMKSGIFNKVPTMMGNTDSEGLTFYGLADRDTFEQLDRNFVERISSTFSWCSDKDRRIIGKMIRSYYFGRKPITPKSIRGFLNYYSDTIAYGTNYAYSKLLTRLSDQPVYNYYFSYTGDRSYLNILSGLQMKGAAHGDELFYLFKPVGLPLLLSNADKLIVDRITTLFSNFMKFGNPTPKRTKLLPIIWPTAAVNASNTLRLDRKLSIIEDPQDNFLLRLLCEYGESGHVPCDSAEKCRRRKRKNNQC